MSREAVVEIHLNALRNNLSRVRNLASNSQVYAMVKANAYGHGLVAAVQAFSSADGYGVASLAEAQSLRALDQTKPILLLGGVFDEYECSLAVASGFELVCHQEQQIAFLEQQSSVQPVIVWLKINTGMNRLGVYPKEVVSAIDRLQSCSCVSEVRLMSHFACADDIDNKKNLGQYELFLKSTDKFSLSCSMANSAAILTQPDAHFDFVRPGIMLYGASPLVDDKDNSHLEVTMSLCAKVVAIHDLEAGDEVGYGGAWRAEKASKIGIIGIGYGDGYPRHAPSGTPVWIGGQKVPLIGRVSMDMIAVDLTLLDGSVLLGDSAELWGKNLPINLVAKHVGTISYELLCQVTDRPVRRLIEG